MKNTHLFHLTTSILAVAMLAVAPAFGDKTAAGKSLFDGKTLKGWNGDPKFWKAADGAIVGQTTKETPTNGNTFIIWEDGKLTDFDLTWNSRSRVATAASSTAVSLSPGSMTVGASVVIKPISRRATVIRVFAMAKVFAEFFLTVVSTPPSLLMVGKLKKNAKKFGDSKEIGKAVKKNDWNTYRITAKGYHFTHYINDVKTTELTDNDEKTRRADGVLALQLHAGPPMKVSFRKIYIK